MRDMVSHERRVREEVGMGHTGIPSLELHNGVQIPAVGLGTFPMDDHEVQQAMRVAQEVGYSLFDTSAAYGNEKGVGKVLRKCDFVTTKIANKWQKRGRPSWGLLESKIRLHHAPLDLVLLHWPYPDRFIESWKYLEHEYKRGKCRAIGVANFHIHHLEELLESCSVVPMVNQVELHPLLQQDELVSFCQENRIVVEAYSPFARMDGRLIQNSSLIKMAETHSKSVTQIILRWNYQRGIISIPKTSSRERMIENASIFDFELSPEEMKRIAAVDAGVRVRFDPDDCDFDIL